MKELAILAVAASALALAAGKVEASGEKLILNISGAVQYQYTNTALVGKTKIQSFNNATIYNMISNAVANAKNGIATNLPARGMIEFDPQDSDGLNTGFFYVTDKTNGFNYALSGYDTNTIYYSFMELDSTVIATATNTLPFGFSYPFNGSANYNLNASGDGSLNGKNTALLFVHDNPYVTDVSDSPDNFYSVSVRRYRLQTNSEAFEIQGIMTVNLTYKTNSITGGSLSLTGTGNAILDGNTNASVISGHASF